MTRATHLPVISGEGELVGLLSKDRVQRELSLLGIDREESEFIPLEILETELHENVIQYFKETSLIPVIGMDGEKKDTWDKPRFLAAFTKLDSKRNLDPKLEEISSKIDKQKVKHDSINWFMELILSHFPDGLLATDVSGNSIFYNESFENKILTAPIFKDSIQIAEKFLHELNRELIANYLNEHDLNFSKETEVGELKTNVAGLGSLVRLTTLKKDKKVVGFLYHFFDPNETSKKKTKGQISLPALEDSLQNKISLEKILEATESFYILETLKRNKKNISHSASDLKIPRTTLQNRIKYLNLFEKLEEDSKEKQIVPRKRGQIVKKGEPSVVPKKQISKQKQARPVPKKKKVTPQARVLVKKQKNSKAKSSGSLPSSKKKVKLVKKPKTSGKNKKKRP